MSLVNNIVYAFKIQKSNNEAQIFKYINYPVDTCWIRLGVMACVNMLNRLVCRCEHVMFNKPIEWTKN
jgi:hypothetical protein